MRRTIHLTSPHSRGQDVKDCQWLLHKHGYHVTVDGDFGPATASACRHWKTDFGFPLKECEPSFGQRAYDFITGKKKQPLTFRVRAKKRRLVEAQKGKSRTARTEAALNLAISQLGTKESPFGSNRVKYDAWYGFVGPWCAAFVSWSCAHIAHPFRFRYSFCPSVVADARAHRNGLTVAGGPAHDVNGLVLALFDWPGESRGEADHIGITIPEWWLVAHHRALLAQGEREFGPLGAGEFWTVEGNTSIGNQSNGGEVMFRKRHRSDVQQFVRVL